MPEKENDALESEVRDLARRMTRLEAYVGLPANAPGHPPVTQSEQYTAAPAEIHQAASLVPIVGRALVGLAGAYLLRALTDGGTVAPRIGIAAGIFYAMGWLVWAARTDASHRLEAALHGLTSVLVLSPLLWEATVRFHVLSSWAAGSILASFAIFGLAISWRKNLLIVATIATLAGLGTAGALLMGTRDVVPFTLVLLAIAAAVEASACLNHWLSERWLAAAAADLSVLLATWLVTNPRGLPPSYAPIPYQWLFSVQVGLLAIYLSSTMIRTLLRGFTFTGFETAQCAVAFAITVGGGLRVSTADPRLAPVIGILALAGAVACYVVSLRQRGGKRNLYTYSTFAILLVLVGSRILLPGAAANLWLALAVLCAAAGSFFGRTTLAVHAVVYLFLSLAGSGTLEGAGALLLATSSDGAPLSIGLWTGALAAIGAWLLSHRASRYARLSIAAVAVWMIAGIAAGAIVTVCHVALGSAATHAYCATLKTAVLVSASLLLARFGSLLIYPAMLLGGYRLLTQDLHGESKAALFLSLLVYGAALMAIPRLKKSAS